MNKITLDPSSLLAGAALALITTFAMGAQSAAPQSKDTAPKSISANGSPAAKDMVYIKETKDAADGFTVPAGHYLIITGVGHPKSPTLAADSWTGVLLSTGSIARDFSLTGPDLVHSLGSGIAVPAGEVVSISDYNKRGFAFAIGYLEDA